MTPVLYAPEVRKITNMGLGTLGDAAGCRVYWALNGQYELEMDYPVTGRRWAQLAQRQLILASTGPDEPEQLFRIYRISSPLLGVARIYARHVAYDLMGYSLRPFSAQGLAAALEQVNGGAAVDAHGFEIGTDMASGALCAPNTPRSVWSMLGGQRGSLLDVYGGEWAFDRFTATLRQRIGEDLGVQVRYGINLKSLEQDENVANTWTAVHPYWLSADGETVVTLPEDTVSAGEFDHTRVLVLDLSAEFEEAPTEEQLRSRTRQYISSNHVGVPDVGLDVDFVPLDQTEEYKRHPFLQKVHKGDSVSVEFPTAWDAATRQPKALATATARVVEYTWLPMEDKYERIRLGEKRANFVSAMAQTQKDVSWLMTRRW